MRAGLGASVAVGVAAAAHAAGHGGFDPHAAGWTLLALVGPAWWAAGRRRGWGGLALSQLVGQQVAHLVLSAANSDTGSIGHLLPTDVMLYTHLLGAALSATWLLWGERRAWAAARRWVAGVLDVPGPVDAPAAPAPAEVAAPGRARSDALRHALVRRGPPAAAVA